VVRKIKEEEIASLISKQQNVLELKIKMGSLKFRCLKHRFSL